MTHRTTFALDPTTAQRLKELSTSWNVSQAEVVRRSVEIASLGDQQASKPNPLALLKAYHAKGGLDQARADSWLTQINKDRKQWRA